jgi:hypothetical protein
LAYEPLPAFSLIATILTAIIILIYIAVNVSCILYYTRARRDEFNAFKHAIVPLVGIAMFVPAWLTAMGIPVFEFIAKLAYPLSLAGPVVGVLYLVGLAYLFYLRARVPQRLRDTGRVFEDEAVA